MTFNTTRTRALNAHGQRTAQLAGPARQRYTTVPFGTEVHPSREAARAAWQAWVGNPTATDVITTGGSGGYYAKAVLWPEGQCSRTEERFFLF